MNLDLPREKISRLFLAAGVPHSAIKLSRDFYAVLNEDDVHVTLAQSFTSVLRQMKFTFKEGSRVCVHFALGVAFWANYFNSEQAGMPETLALGEVWCNTKAHAFTWAVHRTDSGENYLAWYESQISLNGFVFAPVTMTRADCESVILCKA